LVYYALLAIFALSQVVNNKELDRDIWRGITYVLTLDGPVLLGIEPNDFFLANGKDEPSKYG
jgi:hypothetical protein